MAEILLFHHAQGQTPGFLAFADELRAAGHVVHAPDLYDGRTFTDLDEGVGYAKEVGFETIARARSTCRRRLAERSSSMPDSRSESMPAQDAGPDAPGRERSPAV